MECLRDELQVPLLSLSCGNLGNDAQEIERNLEMLFYRAQLWNCLTLLDEADVVLVERGRDQFKENEVCSGRSPCRSITAGLLHGLQFFFGNSSTIRACFS